MSNDLRTEFIKAATWHGTLEEAERILAAHPALAASDIHTAAITGNADAVVRFLADDPANASAVSAPYGGNALVYLALSKYLRLHKSRSENFLRAAKALLDAGADPNSGFWTTGQYPEFETALYSAAGVAHHGALTKLLLEYGADPNDPEAAYHSPETTDNTALKALVETGKLTEESLIIMLVRKHDWHDYEGAKYLLEQGADPNGERARGWYPLHHALERVNGLAMIKLLLEHNANPFLEMEGLTAIARAAREGRHDVLKLFAEKGIAVELDGVDKLIAACALGDGESVQRIIEQSPSLLPELLAVSDTLLARCCICNNEKGVAQLLALGVDVNTPYKNGDGYFGIPAGSLPIHVAAWMCSPAVMQLLLAKGCLADVPDKNGLTPLALAVKACVDSWWTEYCSPGSVKALLDAGASVREIPFPSGNAAIDILLENARNQ